VTGQRPAEDRGSAGPSSSAATGRLRPGQYTQGRVESPGTRGTSAGRTAGGGERTGAQEIARGSANGYAAPPPTPPLHRRSGRGGRQARSAAAAIALPQWSASWNRDPRRGIAGKPASANRLGQPKHSAHGTDAVGGVMGESDSHFVLTHFLLLLHPVDSQEILKQEASPRRLCVHIDARPGREGPGISLYMAGCLTLP
jgi:hypothetical protein